MASVAERTGPSWPRGIVPVVQTPFAPTGEIDTASLDRLVEDALAGGASGFLAPVVASEAACLTFDERRQIVERLAGQIGGRVALIVGASADDPHDCRRMAQLAEDVGAFAWLAAVPQEGYRRPETILPYFQNVCRGRRSPLIIQDLQFNGPGLPLETIVALRDHLPLLQGIKIETVPAGPKYTAVRQACGPEFFIAGGWAVPQMIEALDRGVDAMIPESSMVRVYQAIARHHAEGRRDDAVRLFRALVPVLAFANQELATSIAFFKRLLVRKGIFATDALRLTGFAWDAYNRRIADELIELYLELEAQCA